MTSLKTTISQFYTPSHQGALARRYDLDSMRVLAFGLLILFHVGMFYTQNWGWHVKSSYRSSFLESVMLIVEPWRMSILWLIAGVAIRYVFAKFGLWLFITKRSLRLLLPLLFGVLVVVPPQLYSEMSFNGDLKMSYWQFLAEFFSTSSTIFEKYQYGIWPHIDVNHLWFIRSLWQFSLLMCVLVPLLNAKLTERFVNWVIARHGAVAIFIGLIPVLAIEFAENLDGKRDIFGLLFLIYGYLLAWQEPFWQKLKSNFRLLSVTFVICTVSICSIYTLYWHGDRSALIQISGQFIYSMVKILGVLTLLSFAGNYLNRNSKLLSYFNDAVYPFYILHQTLIVVIGYQLSPFLLGPVLEPLVIIVATTLGCFLGYEIIKRVEILRPLFGLKMANSYSVPVKRLGYVTAALLVVPIGWEVLL